MLSGKKLVTRAGKEAITLRALAHPHRIAIIHLLAQSDMRLKELAGYALCSQSLLAHHLKELTDCGFIEAYRVGSRKFYRLNKKRLEEVKNILSL